MSERCATILFVEDELLLLNEFARMLRRQGHEVLTASDSGEVMTIIRAREHIDVVVTDVQLPLDPGGEIGALEADGGRRTGVILARELRRKFKRVPIIFWTDAYDRALRAEVMEMGNATLVAKRAGAEPVQDLLDEALNGISSGARPKTFIVHGHDEKTMCSIKSYLQQTLGFPEPLVLRDLPSHGQTIIEKLEGYTHAVDIVFVLLTPDDEVVSPDESGPTSRRSRQNVIFEMGYFLGVLGRNTGRVILLYRQPVELPSDIGGMISIDISKGLDAADNEIRGELREWL